MILDVFEKSFPKGDFKSVGIYRPERDSTDIYVGWRDNEGTLWCRAPNGKRIEIPEGGEMPLFLSVPGKLEMV